MAGSESPVAGAWPLAFALVATLLAGCSYSVKDSSMAGTYEGPPVAIGQGEAQTFVTLDEQGIATTLGIWLSEAALTGLPITVPSGGAWEYDLALPDEAAGLGYDHVTVDWNPRGHIPQGIYDSPHFDFHFYTIGSAARDAITAVGDDLERMHKPPPEGYMPAGYVLPPGTEVPRMGAHAIDPASDEFHGKPFATTFIYGFYDGKVIFMEPMMTLAYLLSEPSVSMPVKQPPSYQPGLAYPASYRVHFDEVARRFEIALSDLAVH